MDLDKPLRTLEGSLKSRAVVFKLVQVMKYL